MQQTETTPATGWKKVLEWVGAAFVLGFFIPMMLIIFATMGFWAWDVITGDFIPTLYPVVEEWARYAGLIGVWSLFMAICWGLLQNAMETPRWFLVLSAFGWWWLALWINIGIVFVEYSRWQGVLPAAGTQQPLVSIEFLAYVVSLPAFLGMFLGAIGTVFWGPSNKL